MIAAASVSANVIGNHLLNQATMIHPALTKTRADAGFHGEIVEHGATLGIMQHRRLARDYEARPDNSASMITIAVIDNFARRLTDETTPIWHDLQTA